MNQYQIDFIEWSHQINKYMKILERRIELLESNIDLISKRQDRLFERLRKDDQDRFID